MPDRTVQAVNNPYYSNLVSSVTTTVGTEAANAINVAIQLKGPNGDVSRSGGVFAYLSDNADGSTIAVSAPSGGWAIGTDGLLIPVVANKAAYLISEADGDIDVTITEVTDKTFYLVIVLPDGSLNITTVDFA